jgi:hypothetical protein
VAAPLFTIGYDGATPARLIAALRAAGVTGLVDVRAIAASRKPGFAKTALSAALAEAGIGYEHLRALGTPAAGRAAARAGRTGEMRRIFAAHLAGTEAQAALAALSGRARRERLCLLCLEADPSQCHRTLVAEAVAAGGGIDDVFTDVTVDSTEVRGNVVSAPSGPAFGGGIHVQDGNVTLQNRSRVTSNTAQGPAAGGGGIFNDASTVSLSSDSLVLSNNPDNCAPPGSVPGCTG